VARTILVVDDQASVRDMLRDYLGRQGFRVVTAVDGREALMLARSERPDLMLLDLLMPELKGTEVLTQLRRESNLPVIVLTAQIEDTDRIVGLELGADDYICKPFNLREVKARIEAVLRRASATEAPEMLRASNVTLDQATRRVVAGGRSVDLRPSEFDLLAILMSAPGRVFSRADLLARLAHYDGAERTVDVHVKNLRAKLELDPAAPKYIQTVFGVGYRFNAEEPA
jgi:two-component system alkaline phosphatase synthesis response regulator PhoP